MIEAQVGKGSPFTIERREGKAPGTVIFRFRGIFTARDMYASLPPVELQDMLEFHSAQGQDAPTLNILDLTDVPYMDSCGLGMIVKHYARCKGKGIQFIAAGSSPRVLELFRLTKLDTIIPMAATLMEADTD